LEGSKLTLNEGNRRLTVQILSKVRRKCGGRGRTELHERESTMNENKNPMEGRGRDPEKSVEGVASLS